MLLDVRGFETRYIWPEHSHFTPSKLQINIIAYGGSVCGKVFRESHQGCQAGECSCHELTQPRMRIRMTRAPSTLQIRRRKAQYFSCFSNKKPVLLITLVLSFLRSDARPQWVDLNFIRVPYPFPCIHIVDQNVPCLFFGLCNNCGDYFDHVLVIAVLGGLG